MNTHSKKFQLKIKKVESIEYKSIGYKSIEYKSIG